MKKRSLLIVSLLVLSLSVVLLGCPPPDEETFDPTVPSDVMTILRTEIGYTGGFPFPADTNYSDYFLNTSKDFFAVIWTDGDEDKFASYKAEWEDVSAKISQSRALTADKSATVISSSTFTAYIAFTSAGGTDDDGSTPKQEFDVPENGIYFKIIKW